MNFFEQQERAKRNSIKLVVLMGLAVISLIAISSIAVAAILALLGPADPYAPTTAQSWLADMIQVLDWNLVGSISLLVIGVVIAGSLFKHVQLRSGGKAVAESLNARPIDPGSVNPEERKVLNVVEEMSIASGIPVPPVYVMDDDSINAFAAGHTPQDAVIGVTRGCMRLLSRDELQGVIAHEFSHIFHGDMRLNTKLVATLHGILLIGLLGYVLLRSAPFRRGNSRDNSALIVLAIGMVLVVVGFAGTFFGNLIKAAVSRQREFLADASAVQFTRNPHGIGNALKKIGGHRPGSAVQAANASEYSHMFFGKAVGGALSQFMATHPPLEQRIRRVQPDWDGNFISPRVATADQSGVDMPEARNGDILRATTAGMLSTRQLPTQNLPLPAQASHDAINAIGQPAAQHINYAQQIIDSIDPALYDAAHDTYAARALIYGLLLDTKQTVHNRQFAALARIAEPDTYQYVTQLAPKLMTLDTRSRLPLVSLALPALKQLSDAQYATFKKCLSQLILADQEISLMEWALYRIVIHNIEPASEGHHKSTLHDSRHAAQILLSALAHAGRPDDDQAHQAFDAALATLPFRNLEIMPRKNVSTTDLDSAVIRLMGLPPAEKRTLMQALARVVEHDGFLTVTQAELLRAIGDSLACPLPPLLANTSAHQET